MSSTLSLEGIDRALDNLNYRHTKSLKFRLVSAIRRYYKSEHPIDNLTHINPDDLIKQLWQTDEASGALKSQRNDLSSIVSAVNADLKQLYQTHKNPEGIIIGSHYTFVRSNEAKDEFLYSIASAIDAGSDQALDRISDVLGLIGDVLTVVDSEVLEKNRDGIAKIKSTLNNLSRIVKADKGQLEAVDEQLSDPNDSSALPKVSDENNTVEVEETVEDLADTQKTPDKPLFQTDQKSIKEIDKMEEDLRSEKKHEAADSRKDHISSDEIVSVLIDAEESEASVTGSELETGSDALAEIDDNELDRLASIIEEDNAVFENKEIEGDEDEVEEVLVDPSATDTKINSTDHELEEIDEDELDELAALTEEKIDADELENMVAEIEDEADLMNEFSNVSAENEIVEEVTDAIDVDEELLTLDDEDSLDDVNDIEDEDVIEMDPDEYELVDEDLADDSKAFEQLIEIPQDGDEPGASLRASVNGDEQVGLPGEIFSDDMALDEKDESPRLLAEQFDAYLGAMERYYNQYLLIDAKQFTVGCKSPQKDELSEKVVTLPDFYIGKFPVTNALFEVFVERTGYLTTAEKKGYGFVYRGRIQKTVDPNTGQPCSVWNAASESAKVEGACWYQPVGAGSSLHKKRNHPVVQVSLEDAEAFAAWTGKRIPTEIEWEAASRTREGNIYPWGSLWKEDACNIEDSAVADTTPVDFFPEAKNFHGMFDTLGNVLEWTSDQRDFRQSSENDASYYIARGGSWLSKRDISLCSRYYVDADHSSNILGFRCVVV